MDLEEPTAAYKPAAKRQKLTGQTYDIGETK